MTFLGDAALDHLRRVAELPAIPGGRYELVREIGQGGMGNVYLARDLALDRNVAIKVLGTAVLDEDGRARLAREAKVLARLEHPGIVPVHDVGLLDGGGAYYTMKLVEGRRLDEHVEEHASLRERLRIFARICDAVAFAHDRDVLHRDLKPSNVMVGPFGEVLVMDWGLAKLLTLSQRNEGVASWAAPPPVPDPEAATRERPVRPGAPGTTLPGAVLGTPGYMAPEQELGGTHGLDARVDVFALGVILRELVDGAGEAPPKRLASIVERATQADRVLRYENVSALAADVARFVDGEKVLAYREGPLDVIERWFARYRAPVLLLLAYVVMRALIFFLAGT